MKFHIRHRKFHLQDIQVHWRSIITEQDKIIEKWREYFDQLLNCEDPPETFTWISSDPNDSECPPPSRIEVVNQLNRLKNNKTPVEDGIQGEILKNLNEVAINRIHDIIENLWSEEQLPKDWGTALICPIYKKRRPAKMQ